MGYSMDVLGLFNGSIFLMVPLLVDISVLPGFAITNGTAKIEPFHTGAFIAIR